MSENIWHPVKFSKCTSDSDNRPQLAKWRENNLSATHAGMRPDGGTGFGLMISPLASVDGGDGAPVVAKLAVAEDVRRRDDRR